MTRMWARAPRGERICEATPQGRWEVLTTLGAMSLRGIDAAMTIESATDGEVFKGYVKQVLCPKLRLGDVVILDNLATHKIQGVREVIEATGARLLYLPPYSPDFNPIESMWSKIKQILRCHAPRSDEQLLLAAETAFQSISATACKGFFFGAQFATL